MKRYIFGQKDIPEWVSRRVMCYRRADGGVGYEIDTGRKVLTVTEGDIIIKKGEYVKVLKNAPSGRS